MCHLVTVVSLYTRWGWGRWGHMSVLNTVTVLLDKTGVDDGETQQRISKQNDETCNPLKVVTRNR